MKKERRHELHTNALADWLGNVAEQATPYRNTILGVTLLVAGGILVAAVWYNHSAATAAEAWEAMRPPLFTPSEQDLRRVTTEYPSSPAAVWARVIMGDDLLLMGANRLFESKSMAQEAITQALTSYKEAYDATDAPLVRQRVLFGMGRAQEALGRLDDAAHSYEELNKNWPEGMFHYAAADRLKDLQRNQTKWFYDQFAAYNPKPPAAKPQSSVGSPSAGTASAASHLPIPLPENPPDEAAKKKGQ